MLRVDTLQAPPYPRMSINDMAGRYEGLGGLGDWTASVVGCELLHKSLRRSKASLLSKGKTISADSVRSKLGTSSGGRPGVLGSAWHFTGCRSRGLTAPTYYYAHLHRTPLPSFACANTVITGTSFGL